jgi:outer membrane protein assembly factor BamB
MKNLSGIKITLPMLVLVSLVGWYVIYLISDLYGPVVVGEKGFPIQPVWETKLNQRIQQVIVSNSDHILVGLDYSVNSFSLETGEQLWKHHRDEPVYSIAAHDGIVYVVGQELLYTLDEETGALIWQSVIDISGSAPEIRYIDNNSLVVVAYGGVYVLNAHTGDLKKSFYLGRGITETCIYQEKLFTFHDRIRAYTLENGALLWEDRSIHYPNEAVCKNSVAYFAQSDSELIAFDLTNQSKLWSVYFQPNEPYFLGNLFIAEDFLVFEASDKNVVLSINHGQLISTISERKHMTGATISGKQLFVFYGHDQTIHSYNIDTWENTGVLRYSIPTIFATDNQKFRIYGNQLILWKNKRLFVYK